MYVIAQYVNGAYRIVSGAYPNVQSAQLKIFQERFPCPQFQVIDLSELYKNVMSQKIKEIA